MSDAIGKYEYPEDAQPIQFKPAVEEKPQVHMRMSATIGKLVAALAVAQAKFEPLYKDTENPAFRSKYADLSTVIAATRPALAAAQLTLMQFPTTKGKDLNLVSLLAHESGEWISSDLTMPATMRDRFDAQSVGSAITYARRYSWQSITGVAAEVDDDGNAASGIGSKEAAQAVGKAKVEELTAKAKKGKEAPASTPSLFRYPLSLIGFSIRFTRPWPRG